ncbi:hypothetical protein DXT74_06520 [Chromobacterium sp. Rain0013]|nr:hypothetical protein DXT74_06520 [Chromobacterium sp. Rain0013]
MDCAVAFVFEVTSELVSDCPGVVRSLRLLEQMLERLARRVPALRLRMWTWLQTWTQIDDLPCDGYRRVRGLLRLLQTTLYMKVNANRVYRVLPQNDFLLSRGMKQFMVSRRYKGLVSVATRSICKCSDDFDVNYDYGDKLWPMFFLGSVVEKP